MQLLLTIQLADIAFIALLALVFCALAVCAYLLYRNEKVYRLRMQLINMCYNYNIKHLPDIRGDKSAWKFALEKLPPYDSMVHSIRPIKLEEYLPIEVLERLQEKN